MATIKWTPAPTAAEQLAAAKTAKHAEIIAACDASLAAVRDRYPLAEQISWGKQEAEARAYLADNNATTPLLSDISSGSGATVADLAARVVANADLFTSLAGQAIGVRQGLEAQIDAATTLAALAAIVWPSS